MIELERGYFVRKSTRKNKKYDVFTKENDRYKYLLSFGQLPYQHFKDNVLGLYKHLDHNDKERRRLYYARHGTTTDKRTAKYWSSKFLW